MQEERCRLAQEAVAVVREAAIRRTPLSAEVVAAATGAVLSALDSAGVCLAFVDAVDEASEAWNAKAHRVANAAICCERAAPAVLAVMACHAYSGWLQGTGCAALGNLAEGAPDWAAPLADAGAVHACVRALVRHRARTDVVDASLVALEQLSINGASVSALCGDNCAGMRAITEVMHLSAIDDDTLRAGFQLLVHVSHDSFGRECALAVGVWELVDAAFHCPRTWHTVPRLRELVRVPGSCIPCVLHVFSPAVTVSAARTPHQNILVRASVDESGEQDTTNPGRSVGYSCGKGGRGR